MVLFRRRWFSVDSKYFELKVEEEGRKVQVIITERLRGRSSWIRFGEEGARILLKGVESIRREVGKNNRGVEWKENRRRYSLELRKMMMGALYSVSLQMKMEKATDCSFLREMI